MDTAQIIQKIRDIREHARATEDAPAQTRSILITIELLTDAVEQLIADQDALSRRVNDLESEYN